MKKYNFLAFDIGATSGRAVLGTLVGDKFEMQELHRFPNAIMELHGKYYWDIYRLYDALKESLTICARRNLLPDSIGIDTWGVDFGYLAEDSTLLGLPRAYNQALYGRCAGRVFPAYSPVGSLPAYRHTDHEF